MPHSRSKWCEREAQVRGDLKNSIRDGSTYSVMVGIGESYLAAFMLALGFSQLSSALITTLPLLAGAVIQLISPFGVRRLNSYARWVWISACVQATSFLTFVAAALHGHAPEWSIYLAASIYWGASMATGAAWNTWISALVPPRIRTEFFSRRSRMTYAFTLFGLLAGGIILQVGKTRGVEMQTFVAIFLAAALLRYASAWFLSRHSEPPALAKSIQVLSFGETFRKIRTNAYGRILGYLFLLQIAVHVSGGFFTPFMIRQLELPYSAYMMIVSAQVLTKALAMPFILRLVKRFGLKNVLVFASIGIIPLPILWLVSNQVSFLVALQLLSGFFWATHELAVFLILFGEIPAEDRTSVLTEFNLFHTVGVVTGSLAGGLLFHHLGQNYDAYMAIFALSSVLRCFCLLMIPNVGTPIRKAGMRIYWRTIGVRPGGGGITRPIVTDETEEAKALATLSPRMKTAARLRAGAAVKRVTKAITSLGRRQKREAQQSTHPIQ